MESHTFSVGENVFSNLKKKKLCGLQCCPIPCYCILIE